MNTRVLLFIVTLLCGASALCAQGNMGMALRFDGDGDYLWIPDAPSLRCTADITIEARVCAASFTRKDGGAGTPFFNKWKTSDPSQGAWSVAIDTVGHVTLVVSADGKSGAFRAVSATRQNRNTWMHVAATYSVTNNRLDVYVDGELQASATGPQGLFLSDAPILAGAAIYNLPLTRSWFNGAVDELRLWNVVRSAEQIRAVMHIPLPTIYYGSADSGLVGYWPCDTIEDLGIMSDGEDDIRDVSIYRNHGDLNGNPSLVRGDTPLAAGEVPLREYVYLRCSPQPVSACASIRFLADEAGSVSLYVSDALGRVVEKFDTRRCIAGDNLILWNTAAHTPGVYHLVLQTGAHIHTTRVLLAR